MNNNLLYCLVHSAMLLTGRCDKEAVFGSGCQRKQPLTYDISHSQCARGLLCHWMICTFHVLHSTINLGVDAACVEEMDLLFI